MQINGKIIPTRVVIMSALLAFFVDIKCVNWAYFTGFSSGEEGGVMQLLYPLIIALLVAVSVFSGNKKREVFNFAPIFISVYLIAFYFATVTLVGQPRIGFPIFFIFTIVAMLLPNIIKIDVQCFIKSIMVYPVLAILRIDRVFAMINDWSEAISMDASYSFLIPVLASFIYFFTYFKNENRKERLISVALFFVNGICFIRLFMYGSRGPLISLVLLLLCLWVTYPQKNCLGFQIHKSRLIISSIIMVAVLAFLPYVFGQLFNLFASLDVNSHAIEKFIRLQQEGDISNGRSFLNELTWAGFKTHPILGNGLDRFDANTGWLYPHNFFLQILYDGGLFLLVVLSPIAVGFNNNLKKCSYDEYVVLLLLLFGSVPYAFVSNDLWLHPILWFLFGTLIARPMTRNY